MKTGGGYEFYYIRVLASPGDVPSHFYNAAKKNQLSLSYHGQLCLNFSENQAQFDSQEQAEAFLASVEKKPGLEYVIQRCSLYR